MDYQNEEKLWEEIESLVGAALFPSKNTNDPLKKGIAERKILFKELYYFSNFFRYFWQVVTEPSGNYSS